MMHLSADGSRLLTLSEPKGNAPRGPLQVWDTHSGHVVHEWFPGANVQRFVSSPDGRHVAFNIDDGVVRIVNWQTGEDWSFDEPRDVNRLEFSPKGRWLFVGTARGDPNFLIDVATRTIALRAKDYWLKISADDQRVFVRKGPDLHVTVSDLESGKTLGVLPLTSAPYDLSADGRLLLEHHSEPIPVQVEEHGEGPFAGNGVKRVERKDYRVDVWDLTTFAHRFGRELARPGNLHTALSPDARFLAMWLRNEEQESLFEMSDTATGKLLWSFPMRLSENCEFSQDDSLVYLVHGVDRAKEAATLTMFDAATGRVLWERRGYGTTTFARNTGMLLQQDDFTTPQRVLDARTGEAKATLPFNFPTANCIPVLTPDGRSFAICGWQQRMRPPFFWEAWLEKQWPELFGDGLPGVLVVESATGRELFRAVNCGDHGCTLSHDASTLVVVDRHDDSGTFVIRAWNVQPTRAWLWAIGVVLVTGCVCRAFTLGAARIFRRQTTAAAVPSLSTPPPRFNES
jgi:WD40 repeat protein